MIIAATAGIEYQVILQVSDRWPLPIAQHKNAPVHHFDIFAEVSIPMHGAFGRVYAVTDTLQGCLEGGYNPEHDPKPNT